MSYYSIDTFKWFNEQEPVHDSPRSSQKTLENTVYN